MVSTQRDSVSALDPWLFSEPIYSVYVILSHKIDIWLNAAAFVKFSAFPLWRLYKEGICFKLTFSQMNENNYDKSFVIFITVNQKDDTSSNVSLFVFAEIES